MLPTKSLPSRLHVAEQAAREELPPDLGHGDPLLGRRLLDRLAHLLGHADVDATLHVDPGPDGDLPAPVPLHEVTEGDLGARRLGHGLLLGHVGLLSYSVTSWAWPRAAAIARRTTWTGTPSSSERPPAMRSRSAERRSRVSRA